MLGRVVSLALQMGIVTWQRVAWLDFLSENGVFLCRLGSRNEAGGGSGIGCVLGLRGPSAGWRRRSRPSRDRRGECGAGSPALRVHGVKTPEYLVKGRLEKGREPDWGEIVGGSWRCCKEDFEGRVYFCMLPNLEGDGKRGKSVVKLTSKIHDLSGSFCYMVLK